MRKVSAAENLLIEIIIIFIDFHERTYLHYMRYFIYSMRALIDSHIRTEAYIHSHMRTASYLLVCTYINAYVPRSSNESTS